jgi:tetratricopeptide (TPR) repeat protein
MTSRPAADTVHRQALQAWAQGQRRQACALLAQLLLQHPRHLAALVNLGQMHLQLGQATQAVAVLTRAIKIEPRQVEAHNSRGAAQLALREPELALRNFEKVVALQPTLESGHANQGLAWLMLHAPDRALAAFDRALALNPQNPALHGNRGTALMRLHRWDEAIATLETALQLRPDLHLARWNIGMLKLRLGQWQAGWTLSEARLAHFEATGWRSASAASPWRGDRPARGLRLLVHSEQGLGDTLQFSRYVPWLQSEGAQVVLEVQPPLVSLMQRHLPGVQVVARGQTLPDHDAQVPLMSLPLAMGQAMGAWGVAAVPPALTMKACPERVQIWADRLGPRTLPRVGVVWSGNPQQTDDVHRSLPLSTLVQALGQGTWPAVRWVSLQQEVRPWDEAAMAAAPIEHFGRALGDFEDTAALCACMDAVVSVCTSVAHLAGSLSRPLALMASHTADWRWLLEREDSPWYPSARVLRQQQPGDWSVPLSQLREWVQRLA